MKSYDCVIIGHVSLDYNIDCHDNLTVQIGGAVVYSSAAAYALGRKVAAVTKLAEADRDRLSVFTLPRDDIYCLPSSASTSIENKYFTEDKEKRRCVCRSQGDPFTIGDIPDFDAEIYHLGGLIYGDFDSALIPLLEKRGDVAVDVQGFLRHSGGAGAEMYFEDWRDKRDMLPYIRYLKTDAAEAEIMTGLSDRREAARALYDMGAKEIMITHNTEVLIYDGKDFFTCPIKSRNLSGRTGRGDTSFAAYLGERIYNDIPTSLLWATATVSYKMEKTGPFDKSRRDVQAYIDEFYEFYK